MFLALAMGSLLLTSAREPAHARVLRANGMPASWEEVKQTYESLDPETNGAPLIIEAIREVHSYFASVSDLTHLPVAGDAEWPESGQPIPEAMEAALLDYEDHTEDAYHLLQRALEYKALHFHDSLPLGDNVPVDHNAGLRTLARMLSIRTLAAVVRGDREAALRCLLLQSEFTDALADAPSLVEELVRLAILGIHRYALEFAINRLEFTPEQLHALQEKLGHSNLNTMKFAGAAVAKELLFILDWFHRLAVSGNTFKLENPLYAQAQAQELSLVHLLDIEKVARASRTWAYLVYWRSIGNARFSELLQVRAMRVAHHLAESPPHKAATRGHIDPLYEDLPCYRLGVFQYMLSGLDAIFEVSARETTQTDMARLALATLRYQHDHATLPPTLDELVPGYIDAVPLDAFSGVPLRYVRNPGGFIVYSVGYDRDDDGGTPTPEDKSYREDGDLLFEVRW
jgi:hypothetical protein